MVEAGAPANAHAHASTEDLANGLFQNDKLGIGTVVRDLVARTKQTQQTGNAPNGNGNTPGAQNDLFVIGGAESTFATQAGLTRVVVDPSPDAKPSAEHPEENVKLDIKEEPQKPKAPPPRLSVGGAAQAASARKQGGGCRSCWASLVDTLTELWEIIKLYPSTIIVPLIVFGIICGLGIWGVMAGADSYVQQQKDDVRSRAVDAATGFQIQLQQSFTPGVTMQMLVKQRPDWDYWVQNFNSTAQELMSRVPKGALWNLQLQPFAQVMMISPLRPEDVSQVSPPRDLIGDPTRRDGILNIIRTREPGVNGPFYLVQGFTGAFVRYPIYVPNVSENETFGFRYRENATAIPYAELPASVRSCTICYNATTREKWWGLLTVLVNYDEVTNGQDAYLATLRKMNYHYALVRPINATAEQVIAQVGPSSLRDKVAVTVEVKVLNAVWYLRVAPASGFEPSWRDPLIAAVVIISFIIASLLFVTMASFKRQRLLLQETVAANLNLAETTKRLEEEKERMDVLLVRQYDLLRCLDANRSKRGGGFDGSSDDAMSVSKRAMMTRIEDARRSLNVAKSSIEDPIQVFEILGAGAFGKVQRGLWRGTVVAVKTMILPANMTGQEKREKMAVMEAAISSSLVHPNIVTTYTYFIRPYHEPTHDGVQNMLAGPSSTNPTNPSRPASDPQSTMADSVVSDSTIHSYEVRLVLEFCDKGSLKDALDQHAFMQGGSLNLAAMLETAADVAKAMVHMHAANVLHSDLKARNIMLKSSGTEGRGIVAKVADFGLSTRMEHQETHLSSCFQGTLTHMAPEVMLEGRISKAADVYSFGILLWELFCAGDPFQGVPRAHLGHAITKEARRPKFPPFAPLQFVALATKCWDPEASQRPTFEEVLSELVRMREELAGDTPQLTIIPPKPAQSGAMSIVSGQQAMASGGDSGDSSGSGKIVLGGAGSNSTYTNPLALFGAGIVVGGSTTGSTTGSFGSMPGQGVGHSAVAQRSVMKSALAQRHLRKMGVRTNGSPGLGLSLAPAMPALQEDHEQEGTGSGSDKDGSPRAVAEKDLEEAHGGGGGGGGADDGAGCPTAGVADGGSGGDARGGGREVNGPAGRQGPQARAGDQDALDGVGSHAAGPENA
ncbi:hypothetical protein HXX76_002082 [Chlamydomonas incerta]|uniref:Protein kinase domain-containing protein n=1 Tax=Chlamydomonas incerta TaxID=51695 RepID=A0A836B055_CHLIN|nr:hypothetical protein HXX76_002082 [Chlamydomonas incerta]|eukprot:KAG2443736.1 hypothetical protein HXX76_002082 [Chlamydomonas incerta]